MSHEDDAQGHLRKSSAGNATSDLQHQVSTMTTDPSRRTTADDGSGAGNPQRWYTHSNAPTFQHTQSFQDQALTPAQYMDLSNYSMQSTSPWMAANSHYASIPDPAMHASAMGRTNYPVYGMPADVLASHLSGPGNYKHAPAPADTFYGQTVPSPSSQLGFNQQHVPFPRGPNANSRQQQQPPMFYPQVRHPATYDPTRPPIQHHASGHRKSDPTPSYPRGPPRKPKQSGFALWVGNLPPATSILQLKDYFSRGATNDIESLFLISKSNCAFVNYKTAQSCQAALTRFHDSRFNGVRLVCRLRYGQSPTPAAGNMMEASTILESLGTDKIQHSDEDPVVETVKVTADASSTGDVSEVQVTQEVAGEGGNPRSVDKFFIVKSLTPQDLEASVRDGIWATQSHNEAALNKAFETAQNVYLIFSANKSGEYFGYARMRSIINTDTVTVNPRAEAPATHASPTTTDGPTSTPTPATESAPKGRIVDDLARGTIFWEADTSSESEGEDSPTKLKATLSKQEEVLEAAKQDWGKPFEIEWINTTKLPFYKTRGLRNPWNSNREVKIARDGTELEPSIGKRLLDMFHHGIPSPRTSTGFAFQQGPDSVVVSGSSYHAPQ